MTNRWFWVRRVVCIGTLWLAVHGCGCAHGGYRLADRAVRWQRLEDSGCRVGTIEGVGEYESRCYICPDGGKVCV